MFTHKPNTYCLGLKSRLSRLYLHSLQTSLWERAALASAALEVVYWLSQYYPNRHSALRHTIHSAQIEKLRDRRFAPFLFVYSGTYFAQDLLGGEGCTNSTIPRHLITLCTKSAPLYPKIKRSKFLVLCKIDAITHKEQTFGSLKRRLPTLLYMSLLLMWESLTALCNRGKSCKSRAEGIYSLCRDAADLSREKIVKQSSAS